LALVTVLQHMEGLTDRQAAEAVRSRIDWKYLLGLPLNASGFHYSILSPFRARLLEGGQETLLFDRILERLKARGLLKDKRQQRTDSTHVLAAVLGDPHVMDHERGKISESFILTDQGYQILMNRTRNSIVQALMRSFVIVEGEVTLESGLQIGHGGVVA